MHLSSQSLSIVLRCKGLLLNVSFRFSSARCIRWPDFADQSFLTLCHRSHVATLCVLYKVKSNSNHCLFSALPSAHTRVDTPELIHWSSEYQYVERPNMQGASCLPRLVLMWNNILYAVFDTETLHRGKMGLREQSTLGCFP